MKAENLTRVINTVGLKVSADESKILRIKARNQGKLKQPKDLATAFIALDKLGDQLYIKQKQK